MKNKILVLLMAAMMLAMTSAPALAASPGFPPPGPGCQEFGQYRAYVAKAGVMGETMRGYASGPESYVGKVKVYLFFQKAESCGRLG
jgi:hypothetical protein